MTNKAILLSVFFLLANSVLAQNTESRAENARRRVPQRQVRYELGYRVHIGGHTPEPDWPAFIEFARRYFNAETGDEKRGQTPLRRGSDPFFQLGVFEHNRDIGDCRIRGSAKYDSAKKSYAITGGGENMWFNVDACHFLYKQLTGDVTLAADIDFVGTGGNAHRKACLIIRSSLDADSAFADAVVHGDGLTSIQYREDKGAVTKEVQANVRSPKRIRIEKQGDYVSLSVANDGDDFEFSGGMFRIHLGEKFYVGLAVCAHDNAVAETAIFSNVELIARRDSASVDGRQVLVSTLERMPIRSTDRRVVYHRKAHFEAPNWSPDGQFFVFNQQGKLYKLPVSGGEPELINTDFAVRINNDHGIFPDGKRLVISDQTRGGQSLIYTLPITGGQPRLITQQAPSYWHGCSPDGKTLAYCAEREGNYDVYTIPAEGGEETRLTMAGGLDDGPEFSPDGRYIYFNSNRSGAMKIWRMSSDGGEPTQLTFDEYQDWFAHPSPDGNWLAFVSYEKDVLPDSHPANKDIMIRLLPTSGGEPRVLAKLFGGQGTMNVPSWSPDSSEIAFVSYRLIKTSNE